MADRTTGDLLVENARLKSENKRFIARIQELANAMARLVAIEKTLESERAANAKLTEELAEARWMMDGLRH